MQRGNGLDNGFIGYKYHQRGAGIGNILGGLFRTVIPLVKPALKTAAATIKQVAKPAMKRVGKEFLKGGVELASNLMQGKDFKSSIKETAEKGFSNLKRDAFNSVKRKLDDDGSK